jgi:hypothetical protein
MGFLGQIEQTFRIRAMLEDYVFTLPSPLFVPAFALDEAEEAEAQRAVKHMRETAAFLAGVRVRPAQLSAIRAALEEAYAGRRKDIRLSTNARTGISLIHNPLMLHPDIVAFATDRFLCGVIERYLRRRIVLADVDMRRVPPMDMKELDQRAGTKAVGYTSSHWHHDIRGRQVKIMIYLTDVTEQDSNFAFLPGTHRGRHIRPRHVEDSRFNDAWVEASGITPVECYGPAGTTMVFDTNPVHRLRRKTTGTVRDSVTFYYTPGQEARTLQIAPAQIARLPESAQALFAGRRTSFAENGDTGA